MQFSVDEIMTFVTAFMWPFFRVAAMVGAAPIFGTRLVPMPVRVGVAVVISLVITPMLPPIPLIDPVSPEGFLVTINQVVIGLSMGFAIKLIFSAVETGGHVIGQTMGLGFAQMVDPNNGVTVPVMSQFYAIFATLIFLSLNGHLILIHVLVESFQAMPIGSGGIGSDGLWQLVSWGSWIFSGALLIALPAVLSLLIINAAFGVMMRAAPQLNVFTIGFPISLMMGFVFIFLSLPLYANQFSLLLDSALDSITRMLGMA